MVQPVGEACVKGKSASQTHQTHHQVGGRLLGAPRSRPGTDQQKACLRKMLRFVIATSWRAGTSR